EVLKREPRTDEAFSTGNRLLRDREWCERHAVGGTLRSHQSWKYFIQVFIADAHPVFHDVRIDQTVVVLHLDVSFIQIRYVSDNAGVSTFAEYHHGCTRSVVGSITSIGCNAPSEFRSRYRKDKVFQTTRAKVVLERFHRRRDVVQQRGMRSHC